MEFVIELCNVSGGYHGKRQCFDLSVTIPDGSITAIIGPNGCGKSTLLRMISGLHPFDQGDILLNGTSITAMQSKTLAKTLSFLPQSRTPANILVETLVLHGRFPYMGYPRRYREEDRNAAKEAMEWAGVWNFRKRNVTELSGGERQKVYLAMLLAQGTPIVLMDEPTSYLDICHKFEVIQLAQQMKAAGKTVVMVLHELDLALKYSDQIVLMENGSIRICDTPSQVLQSGLLEDVFQIQIGQAETKDGIQYYFNRISAERSGKCRRKQF